MNTTRKFLYSIPLATALIASGAQAELEEVIVTAQKRAQSLQDVPLSVTALTSSQINNLGLTDRADITQQIANVQLNAWSPNLTIFNIRGVSQNNFIDINEAPIAVYVDDVYLGSMNALSGQLYDIERIEVLRGPQGTLFGRNATGGLIHYISRQADSEEFNGHYRLGAGSFGAIANEFVAGGEFSAGNRFRIGIRKDDAAGYIESAFPGVGNLGGKDGLGYKAQFQFDASDTVRVDLNYSGSTDDRVPTGGYVFQPFGDPSTSYIPPELEQWAEANIPPVKGLEGAALTEATGNFLFTAHPDGTPTGRGGEEVADPTKVFDGDFRNDGYAPVDEAGLTTFTGNSPTPHTNYADYTGYLDRDTQSLDLKVLYSDEDGNSLTYIAGWSELNKFYTEDGDGVRAPIINFTTTMDYTQITQEIRYDSEFDGGNWQVGLYFMDLTYDGSAITVGAPVLNTITLSEDGTDGFVAEGLLKNPTADQTFKLSTQNIALFGEGEFQFGDYFSLTVGARYTSDDKSIDYSRFLTNDGIALTDPESRENLPDSFSQGDFAGRIIFSFAFGAEEDGKLYLSYNRGIKSGGFNASATVSKDTIRYNSEVLTSYELGYKAQFTNELRFSTTLFSYDYQDYQAFSILNGTPNISNADATASGMELELEYTTGGSVGDFFLNFGMAYMDSDVDNIQGIDGQDPPGPPGFVNFPVDTLNNKVLPNAPELSANLLVAYNFVVTPDSSVSLQIDTAWYDDQYLEVTNGGGAFQESYTLANFSLGWRALFDIGELSGKFHANNIGDTVYKLYSLDLGVLGATSYYGPPINYGVTITYSW